MAIKRACTYSASIRMPEDPDNYSQILVTVSQDPEIIAEKQKADLALSEQAINFTLTQEETRLLRPSVKSPMGNRIGSPAYIQVRAFKSASAAPGSDCWKVEVYDSLNDGVLSDE